MAVDVQGGAVVHRNWIGDAVVSAQGTAGGYLQDAAVDRDAAGQVAAVGEGQRARAGLDQRQAGGAGEHRIVRIAAAIERIVLKVAREGRAAVVRADRRRASG